MQERSTSTSMKQPENITRMDRRLYNAAAIGDIEAFKDIAHADLLLLQTPNKNTLLHIHINAQSKDPIKIKWAPWEETESEEESTPNCSPKAEECIEKESTPNCSPKAEECMESTPNCSPKAEECIEIWAEERIEKESTPNCSPKAEDCIEKESTSFVEEILRRCPSLLLKANANGEIPLHLAARYGFSNMVEILLEHAKEDPEKGIPGMTNKHGDTALHEAVRFNHPEVVNLLTKKPDFPHSANLAGETPLYLAVERRFQDAERVFDTLVTEILRNCPPTHGGPNGRTALHAAVINNDEEIARCILKKKGAHLTKEADEQGWTPLHYAALLGYRWIVGDLLEDDGSAAYIGDRDGRTALHIAASKGHEYVVEKIISLCPDCCELVDKNEWNFIHFAAESGNLNAVKVVFENYSLAYLLNEKDNEGKTPLHLLANHHGPNIKVYSLVSSLLKHPRVDKTVFDKKNLNAFDIISANPTSTLKWKRHIKKELGKAGVKKGQRNITYEGVGTAGKEDVGKGGKDDEDKGTNLSEIKKATETHIVVAALIATVAFAASFTMPGGYISDKGPDQGTPVLARRAAFRAFVISNSIAMMLSSSAVFIYIFLAMPLPADKYKFPSYFKLAAYLNIFAAGAMMVAFMTGQYAVLQHSSGLGIATCVIGSSFFFFYYELFLRSYVGPLGKEASFLDLLDKALDAFNDLLEKAIHAFEDSIPSSVKLVWDLLLMAHPVGSRILLFAIIPFLVLLFALFALLVVCFLPLVLVKEMGRWLRNCNPFQKKGFGSLHSSPSSLADPKT